MVLQRIRSQSDQVHGGNAMYRTGVVFGQSGLNVITGSASCTDFERNGSDPDCQPLIINKWSMDPGRLDGASGSALFDGYIAQYYRNSNNFPHLSLTAVVAPSDSWLANNAVARTNPSSAHVDLPLYVLELADVISTIRRVGIGLIRNIGHYNLQYQFGINPLIQDVVKISQFFDQVGRRAAHFEKLRVKGLRRTVQQGEYTGFLWNNTVRVQSEGAVIDTTGNAVTRVKCSSHIRWFASGAFRHLSAKQVRLMAQDVIVGLLNGKPYIDASTLWEAIPWSWLIDYAIDVSTFLKGTRNSIPFLYNGPYVMRETTTTWTYPGRSIQWNDSRRSVTKLSTCQVVRSTKTRKLVGTTPFAAVPFLSGAQLGIIASLAVTRRK